MRIEFVRSGGFAGMRLTCNVDTSDLPQEQASSLDKLVSDAGFFELPETLAPKSPMPDRFEYRLTVDGAEQSHSVVVSDAAAPESLRPLLNYLTTLAIAGKNR